MRKTIITLLAAALFATSVPAMAMQHSEMKSMQHDEQCQKACDMHVRNCGQEVDSLQERIQRLQRAVQNNAGEYTPEELNKLRSDLADSEKTLADIQLGA